MGGADLEAKLDAMTFANGEPENTTPMMQRWLKIATLANDNAATVVNMDGINIGGAVDLEFVQPYGQNSEYNPNHVPGNIFTESGDRPASQVSEGHLEVACVA